MNNTVAHTKSVTPLEVMDTPRGKSQILNSDVTTRVERVKTYHAGFLRSYADQMSYAFLAGVELLALKETVPHGQFEQVCKECLPSIPERSRRRYAAFSEALMEQNRHVALLAREPRLITSGQIADDDKAKITKAVHQAANGKTLTEFYRDLGIIRNTLPKGGTRQITFHCPHCQAENKGFPHRDITCANAECKKKIKVTPDGPNPADTLERRNVAARDLLQLCAGNVALLLANPDVKDQPKADRDHLINLFRDAINHLTTKR